ncbi:MAG: LysR family transcriptional regulator [Pseudomonas sp.]|uniref:LysR family transcriptional regulator n=1 Tax=Pseudomonas sp. TaxID=306 RepID=UPI00299F457E|nr:LysR family transcriptional regulator [Pseudomonas sp.]MDX1722106.1 LysR family transcriptional regulator [Pseudomonas sp.]
MAPWERLNPHLLRHFLAVSRTGSLTAAAQQLHCVPSNVSARLRQLEEQLDVELFQRQAQRLHLTEAGKRLLPHAENLEQVCRQAWASVQSDLWAGDVCLGSMETTAAVRLPEVLAAFHQEAPRVNLTLITGTSADLIEEVLAGRMNAALIGGPYQHPRLISELLWPEELVLVLPVGLSPALLGQVPVTLLGFPNGCHYRARLERWCEQQALHVAARQSYGSIDAILAGIAGGMGIGLLPRSLLQAHPRARLVAWHAIDPVLADAPTMLVRSRDVAVPPALQRLLEVLCRATRADDPLQTA